MKHTIVTLASVSALVLGGAAVVILPASATEGGDTPSVCVPKDAYTETIHHPAVTETIHHEAEVVHHPAIPAVTETVPGIWQNFSPNKDQGPFDGPPSWPTDPRGTWQHENKPIPPGQTGPDGVYQNGQGNGSWFYRQAEKTVIVTPEVPAWDEIVKEAYDEVVIVTEAWTETVNHLAVTCPETETPTDPPTTDTPETEEPPVVVPETPEVPETPVNEPKEPKNKKTPVSEALPETGA